MGARNRVVGHMPALVYAATASPDSTLCEFLLKHASPDLADLMCRERDVKGRTALWHVVNDRPDTAGSPRPYKLWEALRQAAPLVPIEECCSGEEDKAVVDLFLATVRRDLGSESDTDLDRASLASPPSPVPPVPVSSLPDVAGEP